MASGKGKVLRLLSGVLLKRAAILDAEGVGGFRRLVVRAVVPPFSAGAKIQVLLPSDEVRTYTPIPSPHGMTLLAWTHAGGPGARWMANVGVGENIQFIGPQRSLQLAPGRVVIVGDETSVAVAAAFEAERPRQVHAVIQSSSGQDVRAAAAAVGLTSLDVVSPGDTNTTAAIVGKLAATPGTALALTGCSALVVSVRDVLRAVGAKNVKTKPYWIPGRVGLD
jgi:NADPH-dependent ferric siderophore reductase